MASDSSRSARAALAVPGKDLHVTVLNNPPKLRLPVTKLHDYLPHFREYRQALLDRGVTAVACSLDDRVVTEHEQAGATVSRIDWRRVQAFTRIGLGRSTQSRPTGKCSPSAAPVMAAAASTPSRWSARPTDSVVSASARLSHARGIGPPSET